MHQETPLKGCSTPLGHLAGSDDNSRSLPSNCVELAIGDSVLVVEAGEQLPGHEITQASVYVYVEDVDDVYNRAIEAGAETISAPEDQFYGERSCGFNAFDNTWWVSTYTGPS